MNGYSLYRKAWRFEGAPHEETQLKDGDWKALLKEDGLLVRNTYNFDCQEETCFWNLIKDHFGGEEELSSNTKNRVKKALEYFDFRLIDLSLIQNSGYAVLKETFDDYANPDSERYATMVEEIRKELNFTSLAFNRLDDMLDAVGIDKCKLCTYCWDGKE